MAAWSLEIPHRRVLVTGGGSGIGKAVALELARTGVEVVVLGRRIAPLEETKSQAEGSGGRVTALTCDIRDPQAVDAAFGQAEAAGPITGLVNAAAHIMISPARQTPPSEFLAVVESTLVAAFNVVQRWALPLLDSGTRGAAVLISSNNASLGSPGLAHSSAGKAGTNAMVKSLAREWGPDGLTLNAVGPGTFPVEKSKDMWAREETKKRMFGDIALGRYGELREIVGTILYFLSEAGAFTTGQVLSVDGGLSLQRWPVPPEEIAAGANFDIGAGTEPGASP